jgi:hypothetical protein
MFKKVWWCKHLEIVKSNHLLIQDFFPKAIKQANVKGDKRL